MSLGVNYIFSKGSFLINKFSVSVTIAPFLLHLTKQFGPFKNYAYSMKCISLARCSMFSASQRQCVIELDTNGRRAMIRGHSVLLEHTLSQVPSFLACTALCNARCLCMMNEKVIVTYYTIRIEDYVLELLYECGIYHLRQ